RRADIWAFGAVMYEMLTGRRPFAGETVSDTMAAVLRSTPDWTWLPPRTPASLGTLLRRTLEKDPGRRLRDIGDAFLGEVSALDPEQPAAAAPRAPISWLWWTLGSALAVAFAAGLAWRYVPKHVDPEWTGILLGGPAISTGPRISKDGALLAFQAWVDG